MTLLVVGSVAGSPGATSLAVGLAAAWPDPDRRRIVVEADPDGGRLGAELGVGVEPGLMALALAARTTTGLAADDLVERGAAAVADWSVIPAPASSEQAHSALVHAAGPLAAVMGSEPDGPVWIVDAGRLSTRSPSVPFALAADAVLVVTSGSFPALQLVPHRVEALRNAGCAVSVVVVQPTSWPAEEIAQFVGADVVAVLPRAVVTRRRAGGDAVERVAPVVDPRRARRRLPRHHRRRRGAHVSIADVTLEEVIEAVQEALVSAQSGGEAQRWDDLEREAFAHDAATGYVARRARTAIEAGETPMDLAAESELIRRAIAAYFHAGKFQTLLDLDGVTDIMVNAHDAIWLQRVDGRVERHHDRVFADADDLRAEVAHLARRAGGTERRFDDAKPMLVLRLPDGSRLAAIMNVSQVPQVAIRRNVLPDATLDELEQRGTIDRAMHSLLAAAMGAGMRVVVSGETGAGKTTLLRAMTNELPVEDAHRRHRGHPRAQPLRRPATSVVRPRVGDPRGEHRRRR